jgi:putative FmdB family regulatory protein
VPTYQYACTECGDRTEVVQKFTDDALTVCDACGGRLRKVYSPVGIVFKGSGFYRTDSRGTSGAGVNGAAKDGAAKDGAAKDGAANDGAKSDGAKSEGAASGSSSSGSSSSSSGDSSSSGSSGSSSSSGDKKPVSTGSGSGSKVA